MLTGSEDVVVGDVVAVAHDEALAGGESGQELRLLGARAPIDAEPVDRGGPLLVEDKDEIVHGCLARVRDRNGPGDPEAESVGRLAERDAQHVRQSALTRVERDVLPGGTAQGRQQEQVSQSHGVER